MSDRTFHGKEIPKKMRTVISTLMDDLDTIRRALYTEPDERELHGRAEEALDRIEAKISGVIKDNHEYNRGGQNEDNGLV